MYLTVSNALPFATPLPCTSNRCLQFELHDVSLYSATREETNLVSRPYYTVSETTLSLLFTILDPDTYYPIFIRFFEILSIAEIIALTRTCKRIQRLYQTLLPLQWNVDHTLQRFVSDSRRFRQQMGKNDSLIFGGIALQYFERLI